MYTEINLEDRKAEVNKAIEHQIKIMGGDSMTIAACQAFAEVMIDENESGDRAIKAAVSTAARIIDAGTATACTE